MGKIAERNILENADLGHIDQSAWQHIADQDVKHLVEKDSEYKGSWAKRGGIGAFMMLARKWDRIEEFCRNLNWDIFDAIRTDRREEGILDDIRDLRGYLILVEARMINEQNNNRKDTV